MYQLLDNSGTSIFHPFKKIFITIEDVITKFNIHPSRFALFQALSGDSSDNIPGIKSVGPKTAASILNNCDDMGDFANKFPKYDFTNLDLMLELTKLKIININFNINNNYKEIRNYIINIINELN